MTWTEWLLLGHFTLTVMAALRVVYSRRSSSSALAWMMVLFAMPYIGLALYWLFGENRVGAARAKRKKEINAFYNTFSERFIAGEDGLCTPIAPHFLNIAKLVEADAGFRVNGYNTAVLLTDTDAVIDAFVQDIEKAKYSCLLMFYIVQGDGRVERVLQALMAAAKRGVNCQLLADDLGSAAFWQSGWQDRLQAAGVSVTRALPLNVMKSRLDLRNHRKLLVVDYRIAYTGSYNLVDPQVFKQDSGVGQWVDVVMRVEGALAKMLAAVFYGDWAVENDHNFKSTTERISAYFADEGLAAQLDHSAYAGACLQVIPSAPDEDSFVAYNVLMSALYAAQRTVTITTPYFVPDEPLLDAILNAARRGVAVTLIVPHRNDSKLVRYASSAYYQLLLDAGVDIAQFRGGLLHSKTLTVDNAFALFGTVNMDMRSFYLNMELSLAVYDAETVNKITALQEEYLKDCEMLTQSVWQRKSRRLQRFWERLVRLMSPLL